MIALIRPPQSSSYNELDTREETIISYLCGYFDAIDFFDYKVFDFNLDRTISFEKVTSVSYESYIIAIRETGSYIHYARRIALNLSRKYPEKKIYLYGQTGRLKEFNVNNKNIKILIHNEQLIAKELGLDANGPSFEKDLTASPYVNLKSMNSDHIIRFRASIETTRGCHYACKFCFINSGVNYQKQFSRRRSSAIIKDIIRYKEMGINTFLFHDSEFFGADRKSYPEIEDLLKKITDLNIKYMIYARSDTINAFNNYQLLKESGLSCVFIGVESFHQEDLNSLKKTIKVKTIITSIKELMNNKIYMALSFMTFNRNTSIKSLECNLAHLEELYSYKNYIYLGMPSFVFSYEAYWYNDNYKSKLSQNTYIKWLLWKREQPSDTPIFCSSLEPLMEVYRIYYYEQSKKIVELNNARLNACSTNKIKIDTWFGNFGKFTINFMKHYLEKFKNGFLTFEKIPKESKNIFLLYENYNMILPKKLRSLKTRNEYIQQTNINKIEYIDHGWDNKIPLVNEDNSEYIN